MINFILEIFAETWLIILVFSTIFLHHFWSESKKSRTQEVRRKIRNVNF